ncbi:MAG: 2-phosphosulfolactate phosphatase [Planctomycetales bacterium]|nr:2-phosphosulfolactate phosphatase [Planctomycetales bacterium]
MERFDVIMLPTLSHPHELAGKTIVVADVLRATTTIATALKNGATAVLPCLETGEAKNLATQHRQAGTKTLLAGERRGLPIQGFDLGNSPYEYTANVVKDCLIVFTTTNGTKAMMSCVGAGRILTGAFVNLSATWRAIAGDREATIVCAGTDGEITAEDVFFAGAAADRATLAHPECQLNDQAQLALAAWQRLRHDGPANLHDNLVRALLDSKGGQNLSALGHESDVSMAAELDTMDVAAELDLSNWLIQSPTATQSQSTISKSE